MESDMVASCRIPRKGELLGRCFLISASSGLLWAVPCGAAASLHHWASRDVGLGQGCPEPLVPAGLALRSSALGCSYKDLFRSDIYAGPHGLCFLKQWVVTTIPIFPYKCLRGWVIGNLETIFMWSPSLYLPWHGKLDKTLVCKTKAKIGSYCILCLL